MFGNGLEISMKSVEGFPGHEVSTGVKGIRRTCHPFHSRSAGTGYGVDDLDDKPAGDKMHISVAGIESPNRVSLTLGQGT